MSAAARTRVTIVMSVFNSLDLTRACLDSLGRTTEPFELIVVDNGSTDGTPAFLEEFAPPYPFLRERNAENRSVIATLNRAWRRATTEFVCMLHNDTEMLDLAWLSRLLRVLAEPRAGLAGLYGAKRFRKNGRAVGRTIVHSLAEGPIVRAPWEEVFFVDSVCMCLRRALLEQVGGFDEGYGFYHGLDRDLSFAVREAGYRCFVVRAPFLHRGGATRTRAFDESREREDVRVRAAVIDRFVGKYGHRLPADARSPRERLADWLRAKLVPAGARDGGVP